MKLAVLFLIIFIGTSYQQQLQRVAWMSHNDGLFIYPSNSYQKLNYYNNNKYYQPFDEPSAEDFSFQPTPVFTRYNRPSYYSSPNPYQWFFAVNGKQRYQNHIGGYYYPFNNQNNGDRISYVSPAEFEDHLNDDSEWMTNNNNLGIQSRRKIKPAFPVPKIPLVVSSNPVEQRFLFNWMNSDNIVLVSNTSEYRPFAQTVGIVTTQTVNITSIVTCIASNQFTIGFTTCSRRKRAAIERFRLPDEVEDSIHPSTVLKIESTASPEQVMMEERNARLNELIASSKDDFILVDSEAELINREKDTGLSNGRGRDKRFFWYTTTKTLTSYVFTTTIAYKKISLLSSVQSSSLICIPSGFVMCTF